MDVNDGPPELTRPLPTPPPPPPKRHEYGRSEDSAIKAFADHVREVSSEFSSVHGKRLIVVDEAKLKAFLQATE